MEPWVEPNWIRPFLAGEQSQWPSCDEVAVCDFDHFFHLNSISRFDAITAAVVAWTDCDAWKDEGFACVWKAFAAWAKSVEFPHEISKNEAVSVQAKNLWMHWSINPKAQGGSVAHWWRTIIQPWLPITSTRNEEWIFVGALENPGLREWKIRCLLAWMKCKTLFAELSKEATNIAAWTFNKKMEKALVQNPPSNDYPQLVFSFYRVLDKKNPVLFKQLLVNNAEDALTSWLSQSDLNHISRVDVRRGLQNILEIEEHALFKQARQKQCQEVEQGYKKMIMPNKRKV